MGITLSNRFKVKGFLVNEDLWIKFKGIVHGKGMDVSDVVTELIKEYLENPGLQRVIDERVKARESAP